MANDILTSNDAVELSATDGAAFIDATTPLTRLHFFDGKYLRADAFTLEQEYHRTRTRLANLAGGWGVVNGLGISIAHKTPGQLDVAAGLAITAAGNFVLATGTVSAAIADLLAVATPATIGGNAAFGDCLKPAKGVSQGTGLGIYEITVGPLQGLCGNEAVYGKICEAACVSDSQHPYWREGVVLRLRPITLNLPDGNGFTLTPTHLRNRLAAAYFAAEPWLTASALSAAGLNSDIWCQPAELYNRDEVVIGLLAREGTVTRVIDAWSGRRERMDTQARGYWQGRQTMRPWNVFTAQILQFQCQLSGLFDGNGSILPPDDCKTLRELLGRTRLQLEGLHRKYSQGTQKILAQFGDKARKTDARQIAEEVKQSYAQLYDLSEQLAKADDSQGVLPVKRLLLNAGFLDLPPAGYLPLALNAAPFTTQLSRIFGEGVRLHYHAVRHDEIGHLVEQAQHLDRISLTQGLKDAQRIEDVEVFLPDGKLRSHSAVANSHWWQMDESGLIALLPSVVLIDAFGAATKAAAASQQKAELRSVYSGLESLHKMARQHMFADQASQDTSGQVSGLARTDARPDGSLGLTLIGQSGSGLKRFPPMRGQVITEKGAPAAEASANLTGSGAASELPSPSAPASGQQLPGSTTGSVETGSSGGVISFGIALRSYLAFDLAQDPFTLDEGQGCDVSVVLHISLESAQVDGAATADLKGGLTISAKQTDSSGLTRLTLSLTLDGNQTDYAVPPPNSPTPNPQVKPVSYQADWTLTRLSGPRGGEIGTQIEALSGVGAVARWTTNPLAASFRLLLPATYNGGEALALRALPGEPVAGSLLRRQALQTLGAITPLAFDGGFALTAEHRLFDPAAVQTGDEIVPMRDWVMFRRARTLLCDPDCKAQSISTDEATQVWHLKTDAKTLPLLRAALDKNDAKTLDAFTFKPVGVLRYADESAETLDSDQDVHAMWQAAAPGTQVALARTWEQQPATGQGWQNHFRLFNMLKTISDLTALPANVGKGVIQAVKRAPAPLADNALDGGMLVVTIDQNLTRKALMIPGVPQESSEKFYTDPTGTLVFQSNQPQGSDLTTFLATRRPYFGLALAVVTGPVDAGAATRLEAVVKAMTDAGFGPANGLQSRTEVLSPVDAASLKGQGFDPSANDEILIFEFFD